ncbi:hypothetical protein [Sphingobium bisphenolivorans]|nr:hypothetical protein [Sphingobium bisphenolivorans]
MTIFTVMLKSRAGISRVRLSARNILEAKELAALQWGTAVMQVTIVG